MISILKPNSSKVASLIPDWPELNPRPLADPSRALVQDYQPGGITSAAEPAVGLLPGHMPSVYFGEAVPDGLRSAVPTTVRIRMQPGKKWPEGNLKDFAKLKLVPIVSDRAVSLIESLAPGRNQYFPVAFVKADDGGPLFAGQRHYLLNVCDTVPADRMFPFQAFEANLHAGQYDHLDKGTFADVFAKRRLKYRIERPVAGGGSQLLRDGGVLRFELNGFGNKYLVDPDAAPGPLFVVANNCRRADDQMLIFGSAYGDLFVTDAFRAAAKKAKLTGTAYEDCIGLADLSRGGSR